MPYYVIGNDKGFEEAYSSAEVDQQIANVNSKINSTNTLITNVQNQVNGINTNLNTKQKAITSGTAAPSGGSNGDIYIQY